MDICKLKISTNPCTASDFKQNGEALQAIAERVCCLSTKTQGGYIHQVSEGDTIEFFGLNAKTYAWSGPYGFSSNSANPKIEDAQKKHSGIYTLYAKDSNGCVFQKTFWVNVNEVCDADSEAYGTAKVYTGEEIKLFASNGDQHVWTGPNNFVSNVQNPVIQNVVYANEGIYTVKIITGDCEIEKHIYVQIDCCPTVVIIDNPEDCCEELSLEACKGSIVVDYINNTTSVFTGTEWVVLPSCCLSVNNTPIDYIPTESGNALNRNEAVTDAFGNLWIIDTQGNAINVSCASNQANAYGTTSVLVGNNINLFANGPSGSTYSWTGPNGFVSVMQNDTIVAALINAGLYTVTITDLSGCAKVFQIYVSVFDIVVTDEKISKLFKLFYNPINFADGGVLDISSHIDYVVGDEIIQVYWNNSFIRETIEYTQSGTAITLFGTYMNATVTVFVQRLLIII